jgi:hypothetical protein
MAADIKLSAAKTIKKHTIWLAIKTYRQPKPIQSR